MRLGCRAFGQSPLLLVVGIITTEVAIAWKDGNRSECVQAYVLGLKQWFGLSKSPQRFTPPEHRPDWFWDAVVTNQNRERRAHSKPLLSHESIGYTDTWLDYSFGAAQTQLIGCWIHGGRYWSSSLRLQDLVLSLPTLNASKLSRRLIRRIGKLIGVHLENDSLMPELETGICAPSSCSRSEVLQDIIPRFFDAFIFPRTSPGRPQLPPLQGFVVADEVSDWSNFDLEFAIMGIDNCGSTSLHRGLAQHPEIVFSESSEDMFFGTETVHRLLPLKSQVAKFNRRMAHAVAAKAEATVGTNQQLASFHG
ncbi:unnamed protein product [Polarella glacialis]|uniref:Uncharacterized protein n=1 Tax=Polarella glacialis TaxID=89957 RepID=A0A813H6S7_POLGL|nr:unnamed protein product [Polarella glacialis]